MPAFTFTADATANTISIAGHGLVTGDGPVCVRNLGGALPSPLVAQTDYWVIRIDANTLRLATSSGNALAGTFIDLTTTGSGTNTLEIGVPYRRPITYVDNVSQVRAMDLNSNFDAWKNLHAFITGQTQGVWSGIRLSPDQHVAVSGTGSFLHGDRTVVVSGAQFMVTSNALGTPAFGGSEWSNFGTPPNDKIYGTIPLESGCRIKSITWHLNKNSSASLMVCSFYVKNVTTVTVIDTLSDSTSGAAYTAVTRSFTHYVAAGDALMLSVSGTSSAHRFSHAVVVYDRV